MTTTTDPRIDDPQCPKGCPGSTIQDEGTTPGFTGAPIYWTIYSCGHQEVDDDMDCLAYIR